MTGFRLYTSNRLEILAGQLTEVLKTPLSSPLRKEVIVVQSLGMARWIAMELAARAGISANIDFPFPNNYIHTIFKKILPGVDDETGFEKEFLTWRILKLLPDVIHRPGFEILKKYVEGETSGLKFFQLAERIADTFDQYLLYRPEMIFRWEQGEDNLWQADLWRLVVSGFEKKFHRAALRKKFMKSLQRTPSNGADLPERISVFGISTLPQFHIEVLNLISQFTQVNLFLMNPCREYWFDIVSDRELSRTTNRLRKQNISSDELHLEKGNSLLASMGTLGRDFFDIIYQFDFEEYSDFIPPEKGELLLQVQSDILELNEKPKEGDKRIVSPNDRSIQIHSCHSPMREIEVLHDQLLNLFQENPDLKPRDILVMIPDIETYAPYIQAVFDVTYDDPRRIPFSIADRSIRKESQVIETFLSLLDLFGSRFGVARVLSILESPPVWKKFDLAESDMETIRTWVQETRIRWGIDSAHRIEMDLPATSENTWHAGLQRLLLGYAMPGRDENMFAGILPFDNIEGTETAVLGNFLDFADKLFDRITSLKQKRTLTEWSELLKIMLDEFFIEDSETQGQIQTLRQLLNDLVRFADKSHFDEHVDIHVIKHYLKHNSESRGFGFGFITGGVTFCAMLPMRSIPAKVICLVGMDNDLFPRQTPRLGFDLIAKNPRKGDRSQRNDDRYLFLEAILSAREKLYISYVGQSIQDNSVRPPSVLVSELEDYINDNFCLSDGEIRERINVKHRLQSFSIEYFKPGSRLFSYAEDKLKAARKFIEPKTAPQLFFSKGLAEPDEDWKTLTIKDLCDFYFNPCRFLLRRRLGIQLEDETLVLDEKEPFSLESLDKYQLQQRILGAKLSQQNVDAIRSLARAEGQLPHGVVGECTYNDQHAKVESFASKTALYLQSAPLPALNIDLQIDDFRITGQIDNIYSDCLIHFRYATIKPKDTIRLWIFHLLLNTVRQDKYPQESRLIGLKLRSGKTDFTTWHISAVENGIEILKLMLGFYWQGLKQPLRFFPISSYEYAHRMAGGKSPEDALKNAHRIWFGNDFSAGENRDVYMDLCFGNDDPLDEEFEKLSFEIFGKFLEYKSEK